MTGYIYAIECAGRVKIGHSHKPDGRLSKIAADAPFPCEMLGYWPGSTADELAVHAKFNAYRQHGEWFTASVDLLEFIRANMVARVPTKRFRVKQDDHPLAVWRKSNGITQSALAEKIGCVSSFVCQLEKRVSYPSLKMALAIEKISEGAVPAVSFAEIAA